MINKLQNIIGNYGTVKEAKDVDTTISKAYYIEFSTQYDNRFDYSEFWKLEIKRELPNINFDLYYHYGYKIGRAHV